MSQDPLIHPDAAASGIAKGLTNYGDRGFSLFLRKAFIKSVLTIPTASRWGAIGMSSIRCGEAWARAHARRSGKKSPDGTPTRRANAFAGDLRRCKSSQ